MIAKYASCLLILLALPASAQSTLTLFPSAAITVTPGAAAGWGFTLSNAGATWIEVTSANLCVGTSGVNTPCQPPAAGTFTDFISGFNDVVVGPSPDSPAVTQNFNLSSHAGLGSFRAPAGAPIGSLGAVQIVITYNRFSRSPHDPAFDPGADILATDAFLSVPATISVVPQTSVPALGPIGLIALTLLLMASAMLFARFAQRA